MAASFYQIPSEFAAGWRNEEYGSKSTYITNQSRNQSSFLLTTIFHQCRGVISSKEMQMKTQQNWSFCDIITEVVNS